MMQLKHMYDEQATRIVDIVSMCLGAMLSVPDVSDSTCWIDAIYSFPWYLPGAGS